VNPRLVRPWFLAAVVDRQDFAPDRFRTRLVGQRLRTRGRRQREGANQEQGRLCKCDTEAEAAKHDRTHQADQSRPTDVENTTDGRPNEPAEQDE